MKKLKLGTRGSRLALWQAQHVAAVLQNRIPGLEVEIETIKTTGDKILDVALSRIGDKGLFTSEIEKRLLDGSVDLAVHSMKDLPSDLDPGLDIGAVLKREEPWDVLISRRNYNFNQLPAQALIGTSSLRRIAQIKSRRPDLKVVEIRGNIETRIRKMEEQGLDAIIVAYAGVKRLELTDYISEVLPADLVLPAATQGAIAVEIRENDQEVKLLVQEINHQPTDIVTRAERQFLKVLQGGCQIPAAVLGEIRENELVLTGLVSSLDGNLVYRGTETGNIEQAGRLGELLARRLLESGADEILANIRQGD